MSRGTHPRAPLLFVLLALTLSTSSAQADPQRKEGEVIIKFKDPNTPVHTYYFDLHPRDLDHPQFEWTFQRQLFDCLHDYLIEMFVRTPQNRAERRRVGL